MRKKLTEIMWGGRRAAKFLSSPGLGVRLGHPGRILVVSMAVASMVLSGGCGTVNMAGRERPMFRHDPIRGEVEFVAERREDEQGVPGNKREAESTVFEEKLTLRTKGDIYHPKFFLFDAAVGIGLAQQNFEADGVTDRTSDTLDEYQFRSTLFPQKPYPLTGHMSRSEGLVPRQFLGSLKTVTESRGLYLPLRMGDWPMSFEWNSSETDQDSLGSLASDFYGRDSDRFGYSLEHDFSKNSHLEFRFDSDEVSQQSSTVATDLDQKKYRASHDWIFGPEDRYQLNSMVSSLTQSGSFDLDVFQWEEYLNLRHSPTFRTDYSLRYLDTDQMNFQNEEVRARAGFEHKFYESIITTGNVFVARSDLGGQGDLDTEGGVLAFNYKKKNPYGVFLASYSANLTYQDHTGGAGVGVVIDEVHLFTDPLPITLERTNIDTSSIVVTDITGLDIYSEGTDYFIVEIDGRVQLNIVPNSGDLPEIDDGDTLLIDYNYLTTPDREDRTFRQTFRARQRFKNGFSVYYGHERQDERIRSSIVEIAPDEFTINTVGVEYAKNGLNLLAEYSEEDSTQLPSEGKKLEGRYSWQLGPDTTSDIHGTAHWLDFGDPAPRDLTLFTFGTTMYSRLTPHLTITNMLNWRDEDDSVFGKTEGISVSSELRYDYRQMHVMTGFEYNDLERRDDITKGILLYLRMKRHF
ncbi:MAG: hypothetical protein ACYS8Z_07895 [Planctomycetota bacterium]